MFIIQLALSATCLALLGAVHAGYSQPCSGTDFFADGLNSNAFYACLPSTNGDYHLVRLRCQDNMVFDSEQAQCVDLQRDAVPADGGDIENPTIPPGNLDESTSASPPEPTVAPGPPSPTAAPEPSNPTNAPGTSGTTVAPEPSNPTSEPGTSGTTIAPEPSNPTNAPGTGGTTIAPEPSNPTNAPGTGGTTIAPEPI
ncbi:cuticle collagen 1 isoform X5 [Drosophila navojoa]|uniref:cuticle collagen 1 isoform X4 n=1 Tax=Drosophila navojoa TaxID=7232 RepID=UPI0011BE5DB9|nr:cuticle collagen 1 isoform X4 [Drosophila navojoa]XP_030245678.1 cuticle collagen 1 isoform X5 [Drosophila navojoa]